MSNTQSSQTSLSRARFAAQAVTVGAALLLAAVWVWTIARKSTATTDNISQILQAITVLGGVCIGLLHLVHRWTNRAN